MKFPPPPQFLKHAGSEIAPIIFELINKSTEQGCFPSVLKKASVGHGHYWSVFR